MSNDNRRYPRIPVRCRVLISHESIGEMMVHTRDISDGGIFVVTNPEQMPPVGTEVRGQVQGMLADAPVVDMRIVRIEEGGIGLQFCN
ncbi:PilZ domain-containing protein [Simiduia litorea]|uniref:PilZ domain-containing protein n=1 Tax=Simiduia litorea TaxID=1435348 RepID=UPI0036F2B353